MSRQSVRRGECHALVRVMITPMILTAPCIRLIILAVENILYGHSDGFIREVWTSVLNKINETHADVACGFWRDYGKTPEVAIEDRGLCPILLRP